MEQTTTSERILDAAEALFVEHGFTETSLRVITRKADVNLAAVNYHFGSKTALIQAVFARHFDPFAELFGAALERLKADSPPSLDVLIDTLIHCALNTSSSHGDLRVFMKLLGMAYTRHQPNLREYLQDHYRPLFADFIDLVTQATPRLRREDRFWRLHFLLGSIVFTLSSLDTLRGMHPGETGHMPVRALAGQVRPMVLATLQAPSTDSAAISPFSQETSL
ncbi:TetR/AcrR family transcriptional regulator [Larsenimonas rhizosphaerae]|uniref:TetR/AcrR family transcriptional regulator n=1 Tax=Larsenimonas rhizosphaerae TaxID=2944682 RepID=A0AA41ZKJ8_9GAMM|nr:TetR/AcrR family transcriptional regulator [Larsenimonas rhizosphaerae]MCM2131001.1 TetR/AcrR family transcriptional regulator [Larsenimonas rhizosphaerae]MCX2523706.1 TetR/AcrR family transcriptional regulator [Larsenimonas rhizosphaerae]